MKQFFHRFTLDTILGYKMKTLQMNYLDRSVSIGSGFTEIKQSSHGESNSQPVNEANIINQSLHIR